MVKEPLITSRIAPLRGGSTAHPLYSAVTQPGRPKPQPLFSLWNLPGNHRISSKKSALAAPGRRDRLQFSVTTLSVKKTLPVCLQIEKVERLKGFIHIYPAQRRLPRLRVWKGKAIVNS